jgi:DNA-damage-inducible protein J
MEKTKTINTRIGDKDKKKFEKLVSAIGLTTSEAIRLFIRQSILEQRIPFMLRIPNKTTRAAFKEAENLDSLDTYESFKELRKDAGV